MVVVIDSDEITFEESDVEGKWLIHGASMWTSWCLFGFIMLGSNRWFLHYWKYNVMIHITTGILLTSITIVAGIFAIKNVGGLQSSLHNIFGLFILFGVVVLSSLGFVAYTLR